MPESDHHKQDHAQAATDGGGAHGTTTGDSARGIARVPAWLALLLLAIMLLLAAAGGFALSEFLRGEDARTTPEIDAFELAREQVAEDPQDARARLGLAAALQASGRFTSALDEYDRVLQQYPNDIAARYGRGAVLAKLNRMKDAEAAFWSVLALDEGHVRAAEDLGDYYAGKEQYRSLLEAVRPAVTAHPTEARLQYLMGLAHENLGQREQALMRYRLAVAAVPDMPEALEALKRLNAAR